MKHLLAVALLLIHGSLFADEVRITLDNKLQALANYVKGDTQKPAILILHGFLTNNKFHTIAAMEDTLQIEGYTTLSPTLTLGINHRTNPLTCTSIHTHTLEQDLSEIKQWVDWLTAQGHTKIILVGHSSGSQQILEFMASQPHPSVKLIVLTSTFHLNGVELGTYPPDIIQAENDIKTGYTQPRKYSFLFCQKNYHATPTSFYSYQIVTRDRVIDTLKALKIPSITIMGADDERYQKVGRQWLNDLAATGTELHVVEGANHFFSNAAESKLQDLLAKLLASHPL